MGLEVKPFVAAGLCAVALCWAGCSLVYDADVFGADVPDAATPRPDVDVAALVVTGVEPAQLFEGSGCIHADESCDEASRGVPVVITGSSIAPSATVTVTGLGFDGVILTPSVSGDGTMAAIELVIPVLPELAAGASEPLTLVVSQGGVEGETSLSIAGLDELVASEDIEGDTLGADDIASRYSTVVLDKELTLTGTAPVQIVAQASLVVSAALHADGGDAVDQTPGSGGPGGCIGGANQAVGGCSANAAGLGGGEGGGGGGGGHADMGTTAGGDNPGSGGSPVGDRDLVPLADLRAGGGGGGGNEDGFLLGLGSNEGGAGGGGGGVVTLTSFGILRVGEAALLTANGGDGDPGDGGCSSSSSAASGGGGGAGGAIFVRSMQQLVDEGTGTRLQVAGGAKGDGGNQCAPGGEGSGGRIRVDVPGASETPSFAGLATVPRQTFYRGPVPDPQTPGIVMQSTLEVTVFGNPGETYVLQRADSDDEHEVAVGDSRQKSQTLELEPGLNRVCALVDATTTTSSSEGANCLDVAYIAP